MDENFEKLIEKVLKSKRIEIENFELYAKELELVIPLIQNALIQRVLEKEMKPTDTFKAPGKVEIFEKKKETHETQLEEFKFSVPAEKYKLKISEVTIGATRAEGGTRDYSLKIGGETAMPFYFFEGEFPNRPVISHDVFDMPIPLPKFIKEFFKDDDKDVMNDPAEWARLRVKKYNAKAITLHLVSTDPTVKDTSIEDAMKTVENVLQAVKVPIIIGGSGNPQKDSKLLAKAAEVAHGEKVLLNSVDENMDYKTVAKAVVKYDQRVITLSSMNPDVMKRLNKNMMLEGVKPEQMVMDMVTGAVGYGIEYSISAMERVRLSGLKGDKFLNLPLACAGSNAWGARETYAKNDSWGPRELRGPLWEAMTTTIALLSGADLFMMLHPVAIKSLDNIINSLYETKPPSWKYEDWITKKI